MKKNVKEKKRILSLILAVVMVVTMMPMQAVAAATDSTVETTVEKTVEKNTDQTEKEQQPAKTGDEKDGENPAVSVKWLPDTGDREDESKGDVQLEASLNKNGPAASADVEIRLDKEEADALAQFRNEEGQLDEAVKLTEEGLPEISLKKQENGDVHLCFTLDQDSNDLKQKIEFQVPENAEKDVEIEVTKEDVTVAPEAKDDVQNGDEAEQVAFEFEGKVLSLSVPEKAAQDDEKNTPNDEENNDKEQNAPVGEENNVEDESKQPSADGQEPAKEKKQLKMDAVFANVLDAFTGNLEEAEKDITYGEGITQNVFWADNRDEEGLRPDVAAEDYWTLSYRMKEKDGDWESWTVLNGENGKLFDMDENGFPESDSASANLDGVNRYTINIKGLPSKVIYTDKYGVQREFEVEWKVDPKAVNGYDREDVTEENLNTMKDKYECDLTEPGWYYVLKTEFAFDVAVRQGNKTDMSGIADAVKGHFQLMASCGENKEFHEKLKGPTETLNFTNGNPNSKMTYGNLWKYNLDGSRITYRVEEKEGTEEGKVEVQRLVPDYFAISYDNSEAPNYGAVVNKIHDGGTLYLTLTGKTDYEAVKKWNDEDVDNAQEKRPAGEVQLWRFRSGEAYTSAAPVRDAKGDILTITLDGNATQTIEFGKPEGLLGTGEPILEKYDPEGYEYIYVAREYLDSTAKDGGDANSYDQIFGEVVEENGKLIVRDTVNNGGGNAVREDNNTFLYNGGTLTNRIADTVTVDGVKIWKAAAFQAEFEDVAVEVTLQSRPADEGEDAWQNTKEVEVLDDFYAENLSGTKFSRTMPKYDDLGRELEYRWVESKVTQGNSANLLEEREDGLYFTLNQSGKNVLYRSDSTTDEETGTLTVINSIADTIRYDVEKVWVGEDGEKTDAPEGAEVTFKIYRAVSGEGLGEPVGEFTMDGEPDSKETLVNKKLGIYAQETESWKATVKPLAEYDEEGCVYEYTLLETGDLGDYIPTYKTERDEDGNYKTTVYNGHGGNRIMVRKEWTDNSDTAHRGKVKVNVYVNKNITTEEDGKVYEKDQQIGTAILGENGVWNKLVGIGYLDPEEDVYILEEKVGDTKVPLTDYLLDSNTAPNYEDPEEPDENTTIQYQTEEHKYEATYYKEKVENESIYTVDNRRLGNVDLTAVKTWTDGKDSGKTRSELREALNDASLFLAMKVNFSEMTAREDYYEITREGYGDKTADTVTIAPNSPTEIKDKDGKGVSSVQNISFADDTSEIYFYNLPKYDKTGKIVNYEIREVVVDQDGRVVDWNELKADYKTVYEALTKYQTSVTQTSYVVGELHDSDKQTVDVTNRLQGNKDIKWYKKWKDDYVFNEGQRPDIYLDIYQVKHVQGADGNITTETSIFQKDYKWTAEDENQKYTYWTVTLDNVPKYDSLGYEIMYYAVEKTKVNDEEFDYADVAYEMNGDPAGTETVQEKQDNNYTIKVDDKYYALQEDGTFINSIFDTVTIRGQKVWSSLPSGYEDVNLPTVTFKVLQKVSGETGDGKQIATLTIKEDQWVKLKSKGSYVFKIKFEGENVVKFNNGTPEFVSTKEHPIELPKYNSENGKLYSYELDEDVTWPEGWTSPEWTEVYDAEDSHTYRMDNVYNSTKGSLGIKKFLYLPMENDKPEAYPAVEFKLTRTYTDNTGETVKDTSFSKTEIWTSDEVEGAYEENENSPVEWTHTFENLDIYAPNGSPYIYTVEEVKTNLNGYETYAGEGDLQVETCNQEGVKVEGLQPKTESEIQATFKNQQSETEKVTLKGKKIWQDYSDAFGFRPGDIKLTVTRTAATQPDQDNGMEQTLEKGVDFSIQWKRDTDKSKPWEYMIEGIGDDELEKYAPNGMVWKYQVTEQKDSDSKYNVTPSDGSVSGSNDEKNTINMADLTNSIKVSEPFTKRWVDSDGKTITDDYLGTALTVTFKLQAADKPKKGKAAEWKDAKEYFTDNLTEEAYNAAFVEGYEEEYKFTREKEGRINDADKWKTEYFTDLPAYITDRDQQEQEVDYRVVEVSIQYGNSDPKATQNITVIEDDGTTYKYEYSTGIFEWGVSGSVKDTETIHTNRLPTTDITVEKVWKGDNNNLYNTRPDTGRTGYDWETTFVIQKSVDNQKWENVRVKAANESAEKDLTITLYGTNSDKSVEAAIEGLPKTDLNGKDYTYRARELNTDQDQTVLKNEDTYNKTYTVTYDDPKSATDKKTTATNTLNSTKIYGEKQWNRGTTNKESIKLTAEYKTKDDTWKQIQSVTVDGTTDANPTTPYYEYDAWMAVWNDLPEVMPGSEGALKDGKTQYRVIETVPNGYLQESAAEGTKEGYPLHIYKNVEAVNFSVEKVWGGTVKGTTVVVGLYRTIGEKNEENDAVKDEENNQVTLQLKSGNGWKDTFTGLPKYDADGNPYTYYARELTIDDKAANTETIDYLYDIVHHDSADKTMTKIVNVVKKNIEGTKTWKDNNNGYRTRPDELELVLYRQIEGGEAEKVEKVAPSWPNFDPDLETWTYKYENLPAADKDGNLYTYSVKETVPKVDGGSDSQIVAKDSDGYREANEGTAIKDNNGKYNLTNTLTGKTSVTVEKVWRDGNDSNRGVIKVQLYKNGDEVVGTHILSEDSWTHTWEDLPKYDENGKLIEYTVKEVDEQDGIYQNKNLRYSVAYENEKENYNFNTTITNTKLTSLAVEKVWAGAEPTDSIGVGLYRRASDEANAVPVRDSDGNLITKTLSASQIPENNWKATFDDLPQFGVNAAGDEVKYTYYARELVTVNGEKEPLPGKITIVDNNNNRLPSGLYGVYHKDTEEGKTTITNVGLTSITGTKTWVDNGGVYEGTRPETLELTLSRYTGDQTAENAEEVKNNSGQLLQPTWKTDGDKWEYAYNNLPAADENGKLYTYIVKENLPEKTENGDQYHQDQDGNNFTNTLTGTVQVSVKKAWKDGSDAEDTRPGEITIQLYKTLDGETGEKPAAGNNGKVTLNSGNGWQHTWKELPKYEDGKLIHYTVKELNQDGDAVENGGDYNKDYVVDYSGSQENGYTATNTLVTSQTVTKLWEGDDEADLENPVERPTNITAQLYAKIGDGEAKPVNGKTVKLNKDSGWTHTWTNLPKYDGDDLIHYTVKELDAEGNSVEHEGAYNDDYTAFYATDSETGEVTITNYHQPPQYMYLGQVEIRKDVVVNDAEGNPQPQKVTDTFYVALFEDEELTTMATDYDGNKAMKAIEFNGESSKAVTIDNMPVGPTTHPVTYYVAEVDKDGTPVDNSFKYQATVTKGKISLDIKHLDNKEDPTVITNAFGNTLASIGGTKTWEDEDASERPASIEVILQQNGQDYVDANGDKYIKTVTAADNWTYTFENLPEYDEDGKAYQYSVKEGYVDGYTSEVTGMDIRNIQDYEGYYYEGTVRITKQVLLKGDDYNVKDVYYAGIFNDKDYKDPLTNDDGSQYIVPLVLDDESETTVEITVPFNKEDSAEYYITEVDENGVPVKDAKGLEYKASVKGGKVVLDTEDTEGDVTIVNSYDKEKKGNPNAPNTSDTPGGSRTQTGDNSNMTLLILTMLMALTLMGVLALGRKRKKS